MEGYLKKLEELERQAKHPEVKLAFREEIERLKALLQGPAPLNSAKGTGAHFHLSLSPSPEVQAALKAGGRIVLPEDRQGPKPDPYEE